MTDDVKKQPSALLDKTVPMPVPRGQTREPTTDEGGPPSFLEDTDSNRATRPTSSPTDDTVVRAAKADARISSAPLDPPVDAHRSAPLEVPLGPGVAAPAPAPAASDVSAVSAVSAASAPAHLASPAPPSFDDEVAQRKVAAARPARGLTAAFPRPVRVAEPASHEPPIEDAQARSVHDARHTDAALRRDVDMQTHAPATVEASASSSGVFANEPILPARPLTSATDDATRSTSDPLAASGTAPIMNTDDVESVPTAPIPMLTGMHARDLRYDEPSLPKARHDVAESAVFSPPAHATHGSSPAHGDRRATSADLADETRANAVVPSGVEDLLSDEGAGMTSAADDTRVNASVASATNPTSNNAEARVIGDGIEFNQPAPVTPGAPVASAAVAAGVLVEHTVEHTAAFTPAFTPAFAPESTLVVSRAPKSNIASDEALANDATRLKAVPPRRYALPVAALIGAGAGLLVVVAIVAALRMLRDDETAAPVEVKVDEVAKPIENAKPIEVAKPSEVAKPMFDTAVKKPGVDAKAIEAVVDVKPVVDVRPVLDEAPATATTPTTTPLAPVVTPARDGFGPFVNRAGVDAPGIGPALGRGVRAILSEGAFAAGGKWAGLGVRGDVRRAQVRGKVASVDCALTVVDGRAARAQLSATGTAPLDGARDAALRSAADRCARSLDADLKSALDHARR